MSTSVQIRAGIGEQRQTGVSESSPLRREVTAVFQTLREPVFRYLYGILREAGEAEDVTQEAFLRLYEERRKGRECTRSWIFRVAHNLAVDRLRRRPNLVQLGEREWDAVEMAAPDERSDPRVEILKAERRKRLRVLTESLTPREQRCIDLRLEGMRYREIAEVLGIKISSVQNYLARAVVKINGRLNV